jgi:diguanylate cyclase (GGDEF)-like protein
MISRCDCDAGGEVAARSADIRAVTSPFEQTDARLRRLPDLLIFAIGMAVVAGIAAFKMTAGHDVPVADFFLIPVAAVGWLVRRRFYAYFAAVLTAAVTVVIAVVGQAQAPMAAALAGAGVRFVLYLVVLALLGAIRTMQVARETEARTDHLTGAVNARAFGEAAAVELERSLRYDRPLSLLYLDVDDFKAVNDTFGHASGDAVLAQFSHVLRCTVRTNDLVARLGGDEFAVLMPEANRFAAVAVARRVRDELGRVTIPDGRSIRVSMGIASYLRPPSTVDAMIHDADTLMYSAKEHGRDRIESAEFDGGGAAAVRAG